MYIADVCVCNCVYVCINSAQKRHRKGYITR